MDNQTIGKQLKKTRQNRNMTLDELAEVTGVSKPMLGQIERGQSAPTVTTLWKIATGMKIPFSSFLQPVQVMRYAPFSRHSMPPGHRRLYLGTGASRKSSASTYSSREKEMVRVPSSGRLGLFSTSKVSLRPSG